MISSILCAGSVSIENLAFDLAIAAILVLYFLWGFFKGFTKPLTALISWGVIILIIYFGGSFIGNLFMVDLKLADPIRELLNGLGDVLGDINIDLVIKYIGLAIASLCVFIVIKLITFIINIIIKRARRAHRKSALDRIFGGLLNIIKGALWVCVILAILYPIINIFVPEVANMINNSYVTKYIVQYNPITLLFKAIIA